MGMGRHRNPDGTYNGVSMLSELSGLSATEVRAIADAVKINQSRLDGCAYHEFDLITPGETLLTRQRYACRHCQGEIDGHKHRWHELGRRPKPEN